MDLRSRDVVDIRSRDVTDIRASQSVVRASSMLRI